MPLFAGIESKLDYLQELGVGTVWLSPIFPSPQVDNGYDIKDFKAIGETFGTMQDFRDLVSAIHQRGMKILLDFVPNHSSDQHEWFQNSVKKVDPFTDFYIWREGRNPPNNWVRLKYCDFVRKIHISLWDFFV